ncbi:ABC transporter ATP-binding protein [Corynebacterium lowii]|uniref:Daunorubicin/doxorubicin resistance ATP-binding protein DrrA n=1 Tax=Corynebacterium lowii TaxID=1544413 RepID=A0A0Q0UGN3_9CORY|nr:ABC transporter ATP-binding protein [Corynebacterium lowii]KQB85800.1 Daunorubicin/doxorubicin resistance ATP-binding protein DrrA [Corynebacterium lowii]MDP9851102.1 ABC-2 type transport system ATP-binding protein [Corynebacterium lowii]
MPVQNALELRGVVKSFGSITAVKELSLSAQRGEILALLGPNGAGKTTTIDMCVGFQRPTSGSMRVLGYDPAKEPERVRERIGIMLQGGGSYSGIKVEEMLRLSAAYSANPLDPEWLIEVVGLEGVRRRTYRRLSGGQQQRLSLALALIGRPELVFLDEPTAGMDAQSRLAVWELMRVLRRDGVTVVLTTHLMDEAEALADRVVIMDRGRAVATGTPEELTTGSDPHLRLRTASEVDVDTLERSAGLPEGSCTALRPLHYVIRVRPTPEVVAAVAQAAADQGVLLRGIDVEHRSLEDAFLEITGRELRS